ncbi:MAG: methyltransferase [Candidatus Calescibacterium sp.]|nr:methyltransferase [Candidatus Calescibacterium sp.]MDW8133203.1 methyltransferase [Candidatus Calescibacterium sp.]
MKLFQLIKHLKSKYLTKKQKPQIKDIIKIIEISINKKFIFWENQEEIGSENLKTIEKICKMIFKLHFPIQYIESIVKFGELELIINPHTLIPRPETEILIEKVYQTIENYQLKEKFKKIILIDFGTGSGNMILLLLKKLKNTPLIPIGIDISFNTLQIAQKNSIINNIPIILLNHSDINIIKKTLSEQTLFILISNPPYLTKKEMKKELYFEPDNALLTPKKTFFYNQLINFFIKNKIQNFLLFFEIDQKALKKLAPKLKRNKINYRITPIQRKIFLLEIYKI